MVRPDGLAGDGAVMPEPSAATAGGSPSDPLAIERILGFEPAREYRLDPRERFVACTQDAGGARQIILLPLRGGPAVQLTSSEKSVSDPQWSPDGRRLAFVRDGSIWVIEADGSRQVLVTEHPAGNSLPRWSPNGRQLAFISRRRGWSQVWLIEPPIPRRGRPASHPKPPEPLPVTPAGLDVDELVWSPDGSRLAVTSQREGDDWRSSLSVVEVAGGIETRIDARGAWECGPSWLPDGGLLLVSDADGWFQVVRVGPGLRDRTTLTTTAQEHGDPAETFGMTPLPSPDGRWFVHIAVHDGAVDLVVAPLGEGSGPAVRGRGRPPRRPPPAVATGVGLAIQPWPGVWRAIAWTADSRRVVAIGESERRPQDLWLLPIPGPAGEHDRPHPITESLPAVLRRARWTEPERVRFAARDGLPIEATLWRPAGATGRRSAQRVPAIVYAHGGPTAHNERTWGPFKQLLVQEGYAVLDVDFRGSTGYGRAFREANHGEWGHADMFDCLDAGHWLADQPWCDGRLAVYGGSYGGYLSLCCLVEEPGLWRAGVDLYGDSEIAESYRHGDRPGRIDLHRQMGSPDDPATAPLFRRGSPLYRTERIEAPVLILHGRQDRRVVPLMSEKMIEALVIEGKHHEVHWYDEEAHGWQQRGNRRDAYERILAFLKLHLRNEGTPR